MLNIKGFYRKKSTYIYLIIFVILIFFIIYFNIKINSLNLNKESYENYFITDTNILKNINKDNILSIKKCFYLDDNIVISIDKKLNNNEIIQSYFIDDNIDFIKENNLKIIDYNNSIYISEKKFNELASKYQIYYKVYLKKIKDYEVYNDIINKSIYKSISINLEENKQMIKFFNIYKIIVCIIFFIMILVVIINIIYDNKKYNKMLKLFGYSKLKIIIITLLDIISLILICLIIILIIYSLFMKGKI